MNPVFVIVSLLLIAVLDNAFASLSSAKSSVVMPIEEVDLFDRQLEDMDNSTDMDMDHDHEGDCHCDGDVPHCEHSEDEATYVCDDMDHDCHCDDGVPHCEHSEDEANYVCDDMDHDSHDHDDMDGNHTSHDDHDDHEGECHCDDDVPHCKDPEDEAAYDCSIPDEMTTSTNGDGSGSRGIINFASIAAATVATFAAAMIGTAW